MILDGDLRITKQTADGGEIVLNVYTPGNFFAEVPLLAGSPFMAIGAGAHGLPDVPDPERDSSGACSPRTAPLRPDSILQTMAERVQILQSVAGQREKLDSLGTLAAGLAHELNNPASATRRSAEDLREDFARLRSSAGGSRTPPPAASSTPRRSTRWSGPSPAISTGEPPDAPGPAGGERSGG